MYICVCTHTYNYMSYTLPCSTIGPLLSSPCISTIAPGESAPRERPTDCEGPLEPPAARARVGETWRMRVCLILDAFNVLA